VTAQEIRIELAADVLFDFDQAELRPDTLDALRKVATVIASTPGPVVIEGHTDSKGEEAYNQTLSERRASSVKTWLAREGGIDAARISTHGLGETQPKVPNATPDGSDDPGRGIRYELITIPSVFGIIYVPYGVDVGVLGPCACARNQRPA
jgi:outer membrane protein OmpA-like peptidoglycan-associated protein